MPRKNSSVEALRKLEADREALAAKLTAELVQHLHPQFEDMAEDRLAGNVQ